MDRYTRITANDSEEIVLLKEWLLWWENDLNAPAKMPNSLHTKTTTLLVAYYYKNQAV